MATKGDLETAGQRFSHLLMPIRDLARNWEIDIASDLEGYLEEVRCSRLVLVISCFGRNL